MAKEGSEPAAKMLGCPEAAGEYRRRRGPTSMRPSGEYGRPRSSCIGGLSVILTDGSTTSTTLSVSPAFLVTAWERVRGNRGARSAGVDGVKPRSIVFGHEEFLSGLRDDLKARRFSPMPVRERMIPKPGTTKRRMLGIPTARDRTVQAALKLVLEPILEADFQPCSYGFRPRRRAQDAIAEIHHLTTRSYEWVLEGDIEACFDQISHVALMDRLRDRIGDRRILGLVKAFLKAGILSEDGVNRDTITGTPHETFVRGRRWPGPATLVAGRCSLRPSWYRSNEHHDN